MAEFLLSDSNTFCDTVALQAIQTLQPHGVVFVLGAEDRRVLQVSAHCEDLIGLPASAVLGQSFERWMQDQSSYALGSLASETPQGPLRLIFSHAPAPHIFWAWTHRSGAFQIVEAEPLRADTVALQASELTRICSQLLERWRTLSSVSLLLQTAVKDLRNFAGYDKLMVYQFDEAWNGHVVAEDAEAGMEAYLGLRFPATDIPLPVRDYFRRAPYRSIPSIHAAPVPLSPTLNPVTGKPPDLRGALLKSVYSVHLEYLTNMQVEASLSFPIIVRDQLWGLLAFHHRSAHPTDPCHRTALQNLAAGLAQQIRINLDTERKAEEAHGAELVQHLEFRLQDPSIFLDTLLDEPDGLLTALRAGGAAMCFGSIVKRVGGAPSEDVIQRLVLWLQKRPSLDTYATDHLSGIWPEGASIKEVAGGMLAITISHTYGHYLLCFRPEQVQTVAWAGDPSQAVQWDVEKEYHPRHSFALWQEAVIGRSMSWGPQDLLTAQFLQRMVVAHVVKSQSDQVRILSGLLTVCAACKSIKNESGQWVVLEHYVKHHSEADFSHGLCPVCIPKFLKPNSH